MIFSKYRLSSSGISQDESEDTPLFFVCEKLHVEASAHTKKKVDFGATAATFSRLFFVKMADVDGKS